jgi:hypothetical protein
MFAEYNPNLFEFFNSTHCRNTTRVARPGENRGGKPRPEPFAPQRADHNDDVRSNGFSSAERNEGLPRRHDPHFHGVEHDGWYHEDCELVEFFLPPRFDLCLAAMNNPFGLSGGGEPAKVLIDRSLGRRARRPKTPEDHLA